MRRRIIDPDFWLDEEVAKLSPHARLLYIGLWGLCDDNFATFPDRPDWVKAQVFPYERVNTRRLLDELSSISKIVLFKYEKQSYWLVKNFFKYQRVDRPSKPKYPDYPDGKKYETQRVLVESSSSPRPEVKLSKDKLSETNGREEMQGKRNVLSSPVGSDRIAKLKENARKIKNMNDK